MTVFINGRFLTQPMTGVQRFATEITKELLVLRDDVIIATPRDAILNSEIATPRLHQLGHFRGHLWEQVELPLALRRHGSPILLNLTSTGPVHYKNQFSTHHDITYIRHPDSFSRSFRLLYAYIVPRLIKNSVELFTVSQFSREEISGHWNFPPDRLTVVSNATDSRFSPARRQQTYRQRAYLLAVSSPNAHKNFDRLLEAFKVFSATEPDIELLIVGSQARSFTQQSLNKDDVPNVRYLGRVEDEELVGLYQGAVAFIFPSLYEGFGIPPLEAQKCGCPVVSSSAASMPEVLGNGALYFDPYDTAGLVTALHRVVSDLSLREDLIEAGFKNAESYSWAKSAKIISRLIDSHLAPHTPPASSPAPSGSVSDPHSTPGSVQE